MRRFLRLLTLWLFALALPIQGAAAAAGMAAHAGMPSHAAALADGTPTGATALPCHGHGQAVDKAGCGACCGPLVAQHALLAVAPVAARVTPAPRGAVDAAPPSFVTGGTDRPPRPRLA